MFNYNLPDVPETYVHRIGRTGRAGRGGTAVSFCDINEQDELKAIQKLLGKAIPVVEDHPWPMQVLEPAPKDKKGRTVNPEDAEARAAAKERKARRLSAESQSLRYKAAPSGREPVPPACPPPLSEGDAPPLKKKRNRGRRNSKTLEQALTATAPARPAAPEPAFGDFRKPDPLASDVIMDATARLLAPRRPATRPAAEPPVREEHKKRQRKKKKPAAQAQPAPAPAPAPKAAGRQKNRRGGRDRGRPMEHTLRSNGQKDSTEQPSLMKPYYLSDD